MLIKRFGRMVDVCPIRELALTLHKFDMTHGSVYGTDVVGFTSSLKRYWAINFHKTYNTGYNDEQNKL